MRPPGGGVLERPRAPCPHSEPPCLAVSFHRNSTVTLRPRAEGQRAQGGDNDYAQPPQKSSYLSAYTGEAWEAGRFGDAGRGAAWGWRPLLKPQ